mmetsp:Transcript_29931/g.56471  ORF Transcript_29931/g.56471 Transcript_29931/m.56471 type:complete len:205 (+) Transcript_29931:311-925(+)
MGGHGPAGSARGGGFRRHGHGFIRRRLRKESQLAVAPHHGRGCGACVQPGGRAERAPGGGPARAASDFLGKPHAVERRAPEGIAAQPRGGRAARRAHRGGGTRRHLRIHFHPEECPDGLQRSVQDRPRRCRQRPARGGCLGQLPSYTPDGRFQRGGLRAQPRIHLQLLGSERGDRAANADGAFLPQRERSRRGGKLAKRVRGGD